MIAVLLALSCAARHGGVELCGDAPAAPQVSVAPPPLASCSGGGEDWVLLGGGACSGRRCATWFGRAGGASAACLDTGSPALSPTAHYQTERVGAGAETERRCQPYVRSGAW